MKFIFTPNMFMGLHLRDRTEAAARAQAALNEHLESLPGVEAVITNNGLWYASEAGALSKTHTAVLFNLEPIKTTECEHKSVSYNPVAPGFHCVCLDCSAMLKPKWELA